MAALAVSASLHFLALSPWGPIYFPRVEKQKKEIEVTYVLEKPMIKAEKILKNLPDNYKLEQKKLKIKKKEASAENEKTAPIKERAKQAPAQKNTQEYIEAENLEEYISYYKLLREKIKKEIDRRYARGGKEGTVHVVFTLLQNGVLKKIVIDEARSAKSARLKKITVKSVKSASPFPAFPEALDRKELIFSIAIIFKKK